MEGKRKPSLQSISMTVLRDSLKDNVFVITGVKVSCNVVLGLVVSFVGGGSNFRVFCGFCFLLTLHKLQTSEILTLQLVKLPGNVIQNTLNLGNSDILQGINPPIRNLQRLIQRHKTSLQRRKLNQHLQQHRKLRSHRHDLFTTAHETQTLIVRLHARLVYLEHGEFDTGHVIDSGADSYAGGHGAFRDLLLEVSGGVFGLGHGEEGGGCIGRH
mmetsp:Transcript_31391/g.45766  ORF Transcript_31391/g.45766 Transcript_31391/m.45766 type:complete len:214 (+) Transcript_31391:325-966(+)